MSSSGKEIASGKLLLDQPAEAVARITIRNPAKRNALDHEILDALAATASDLAKGIAVRCLIITGSDRSFSSGYDIGSIPENTFVDEAERLVAHPFQAAMEAIQSFPYPTLAAINGHALGGGLELAVSCDLRVAASKAKLGMPPAKLGLVYSHTGLSKFIEVIGVAGTKELFFLGSNLPAKQALEMGLVNWVVEPDEIERAALDVAADIASNAPLSLKGNKQVINALAAAHGLTEAEERELIELRLACFGSEDFREGVRAFGEKRKPVWRGR